MGNEKDVAILFVSCDAYRDVWQPAFRCFFKYWPDCPYPLFLGSNETRYPDTRISSILVGADLDFSSNLIAMFEHIHQDWVICWLEDFILTAPVSTDRVVRLIDRAISMQVGYIKLARTPYSTETVDNENDEISEIQKGSRYRVSFGLGLWKKSVLLELLRPGETAWDIERQGTERSFALDANFYRLSKNTMKTDPPFVHLYTGVRKGIWTRGAIEFLKQEGLQEYLGTRPQETRLRHLFDEMYRVSRFYYFASVRKLMRGHSEHNTAPVAMA